MIARMVPFGQSLCPEQKNRQVGEEDSQASQSFCSGHKDLESQPKAKQNLRKYFQGSNAKAILVRGKVNPP